MRKSSISLISAATLAASIVLFLGACETVGSGVTEGPTVPVTINTAPANVRIFVDDTRLGKYSPTTVNLLVDDTGLLAYDVDITADFTSIRVNQLMAQAGGTAYKPIFVRLYKGQRPPATINFDTNRGNPSGQSLAVNPAGTRSSAPGRVGSRDPEEIGRILVAEAEEEPPVTTAPTGGGAAFGGGGPGGGGGARGGGGRGGF